MQTWWETDATYGNLKEMCVSSCVTPGIHECTRDAMRLTEKQEEKVQVCETNLVRRIIGVKRTDKRRTGELRVEVGLEENIKKKLTRSSLTWAGHAELKPNDMYNNYIYIYIYIYI